MTIGEVSSSPATAIQVNLQNQQSKQHEAVVTKLIDSAVDTPKLAPGKGEKLNVVA